MRNFEVIFTETDEISEGSLNKDSPSCDHLFRGPEMYGRE